MTESLGKIDRSRTAGIQLEHRFLILGQPITVAFVDKVLDLGVAAILKH